MGSYWKTPKFERSQHERIIAALIVGLALTETAQVDKVANGGEFRCDTAFGIMTGNIMFGTVFDNRHASPSWVHMRFAEPDRAANDFGFPVASKLNKWSGKWNFMFGESDCTPEDMANAMKQLNIANVVFL